MPSVWMPRMSDIGRYDSALKEAIIRHFGRVEKLCKAAGLITFREWNYLERQHDLMVALKEYCDEHGDGEMTFPHFTRLRQEGNSHLYRLIQDFGGHSFVASKLGMDYEHRKEALSMDWGPFDLEYGIALMDFVRNEQLRMNPPLREPAIFMPTQSQLLDPQMGKMGLYLDAKTIGYG
ncbi:MAG: hypothetical protein SGARI_003800, partial [Bacillariaceae sp.]